MTHLDRRRFLSGAVALPAVGLLSGRAHGQAGGPLNVFAHRVMQTVSTGSQGGDITKPWSAQSGTAVQWTTFDTGPLQERLFREASLNEKCRPSLLVTGLSGRHPNRRCSPPPGVRCVCV